MKEDECKDCGSALVFVGSLMSGKMVCRHCEQAEKAPINQKNPGKSNLYNVGNTIGDPAYKGFSGLLIEGMSLEYWQDQAFDFRQNSNGCSCHTGCAPCSHCTHPGHPDSLDAVGLDEFGNLKPHTHPIASSLPPCHIVTGGGEASGKDFAAMIESTNTLYQLIKAGYLKLGDK